MGIFGNTLFDEFEGTLQFRNWVMGGIPKDPNIVEGWLRTKWKENASDEDIKVAVLRTLREQGIEVEDGADYDEVLAAAKKVANTRNTNGFKRDERGLYLEGRCLKAAIKESVNILWAAERMGPTKKGAKAYWAERVYPATDPQTGLANLYLGVPEPSGVHLFIGHTSGPQGRQSNLTYHEYVEQATMHFTVRVMKDSIPDAMWPRLWQHMEENGLGALRSQEYGKFDVLKWERATASSRTRELAAVG